MKKFVFVLTVFYCLFANSTNMAFADDNKAYFAKIQSTGVKFCSSPSENSALFEIPYSYFVKVESIVDDYFQVKYKNLSGFVKKDKAKLMNGTPSSPYANATYKIYLPFSLYESPTKNSFAKVDLSEQSSLNYYGVLSGQQLSSKSNEWIYSSIHQDGQEVFGYIYTGIVDALQNIPANSEIFEAVDETVLNDLPDKK